jgi:hypothetical protein
MYETHPVFTPPERPETIIWRYLNLPRFIDMLDRHALRFTQLASWPDPFEGVPAEAILEGDRQTNKTLQSLLIEQGGMDEDTARRLAPESTWATTRRITYVNCWHMNDFESMAMWQSYSQEGLAIRSTFARLIESIQEVPQEIFVGKVIYRDRRNPGCAEPRSNFLHPAIRKGMSYRHERELRAIALRAPDHEAPTTFVSGINILPVNLDVLIDSVYVAPGCPGWVKELVRRIMDKYELKKHLETSELDERPDLT